MIKRITGGRKVSGIYKITNKETGELIMTGESKHCFTDSNLKPISLKKVRPDMHEMMIKLENAG